MTIKLSKCCIEVTHPVMTINDKYCIEKALFVTKYVIEQSTFFLNENMN